MRDFGYSFSILDRRKLLTNPQVISVLIALFVSFSACFLVAYRGTDDYEFSYKSEQNLGGEYRSTREPGLSLPLGIKRVFDIPVWDQTQGLGQRMPNLLGQQSQTPFVFLTRLFSVDVLVLIRVFFSTFIGLFMINLVLSVWGNALIRARLLFLDLALLGPLFLYGIRNDFFIQADQIWGLSLILVGFMHPEFFNGSYQRVVKFPDLSFYCIFLGGSFFFAGHPSWLMIGLLAVLLLLFPKPLLSFFTLGVKRTLCLVTLGLFLLLQMFELLQNVVERVNFYYGQTSVWDVFSCDRLRCVVFPPIAAGAQPFLRFINQAEDRNEFFNAGFLILLLVGALRLDVASAALQAFLRRALLLIAVLIFGLVFSHRISIIGIPVISKLFTFHIWQLAAPLMITVTFSAAVALGRPEILKFKSHLASVLFKSVTVMSIFIALLNPLVMVYYQADASNASVFRDSARIQRGASLKSNDLLVKFERFILLEEKKDSVEYGDPLFREIFELPFELQASRSGFPTLQAVGYGRSTETLTLVESNFRSKTSPDLTHCRPEVLEFLAVSSIFVNTEDTSGCREKLLLYFGEDSVREINKIVGPPGTASLFRPKSFTTWLIATDSSSNPTVSCPLLEQHCLDGLEIAKLPPTGEAPFRLCENDCLFTYSWAKTENSKQILLPVNFDKTIEIKDSQTGRKYQTANYQGLLAVQVDGGETSGKFAGNIRPDLMMWLRVAMTYLHTVVFLGALGAMFLKGYRTVKEISREPESLQVS